MNDKTAQLQTALDQLSSSEALALARAVELQRAMGEEKLPTDSILERLRPQMKELRPSRVPTLRRLVCRGFEEFLCDQEDNPRLPGLLPRGTIMPWWRGLARVAGPSMAEREAALRRLIAGNNSAALAAFATETQQAAAGWTRTLLAELRKPKGDKAVKALFARPLQIADIAEIAEILTIAAPLGAAMDAILNHLSDLRRLDGGRISELTPDSVTEIKAHYVSISETHGMSSRYLALALLNRLSHPWHIMRIGRALSWKPNDALVHDTEFGIVGTRLILEIRRLSNEIVLAAEPRSGQPLDCERLGLCVERYMNAVEGVVDAFGFRRESDWGEAIMQSRTAAAGALDGDLLDRLAARVLDLMPMTRRPGRPRGFGEQPDVDAVPDPAAIDGALTAARFLMILLQRGQRHGFSHAARGALDQLGEAIEHRAVGLLGELKATPRNQAIVAQFDAVVRACDIMYEDRRGALLIRRMNLARRDSA